MMRSFGRVHRSPGLAAVSAMLLANSIGVLHGQVVPAREAGRHFDHIVIVLLENQGLHQALSDPYIVSLTKREAWFSNYHGVAHPSYPNYLALVSGSTFGFQSDSQPPPLPGPTVVDRLEAQHLTWKSYAENYPGKCFIGSSAGGGYFTSLMHGLYSHLYTRKHVPLLSFASIQLNPSRCAHVVDANEFIRDVRSGSLPNYSFYTPNMRHDGHDTSLGAASAWLKRFLNQLRNEPILHQRTLIVVTWDEGEGQDARDNRVLTVLLGDAVVPGEYGARLTHYSLLRTIEDNFGLGSVGAGDRSASPFPATLWRSTAAVAPAT
jgi:Phosphoesterase family.